MPLRDGTSGKLEARPAVDAGGASASPGFDEDAFASSIGSGVEDCANADDVGVGLIRQPEFLSVFRFIGPGGCQSLDRYSLFRNVGVNPIRVLGLAFDRSEFSVPLLPLPSALQPGDAVSLPIRFRGEANMSTTMTVATDQGCRQFEVNGVAAEDSLFEVSAAALDFRSTPAGGVSEPQRVTFQTQLADNVEPRDRGLDQVGFGVAPDDRFELVGGPTPPLQMRSCVPVEIQIRFKAPQSPEATRGCP